MTTPAIAETKELRANPHPPTLDPPTAIQPSPPVTGAVLDSSSCDPVAVAKVRNCSQTR
jgi:hypothetical protein